MPGTWSRYQVPLVYHVYQVPVDWSYLVRKSTRYRYAGGKLQVELNNKFPLGIVTAIAPSIAAMLTNKARIPSMT